MKKMFIITMIVLMVSMGAFANGGGDSDSGASMDEFVTVTNYCMGNPPASGFTPEVEAAWNEILMDRGLNAEMKLMWIEWADWKVKYNLTVASGDTSVDLIHSSSTWIEMFENAKRGAFMPLDDMLPEYMPETWAKITPEEWNMAKFNGNIIAVPENNYTQYVNHGLYYRGDWAEEFGITKPITTFDEMGRYFQGIIDNKPGVVPWDVPGSFTGLLEGYYNNYTTNISTRIHSSIYGESFEDPYNLFNRYFEPEFEDYAKLMKEWGDAGYWRQDVLSYDGDAREGMKAGTSGSDEHHVQTFRFLKTEMDEDQPGSNLQMFKWCDGPTRNLVAEPITHGATSVSSGSQHPERALQVLELIRTDKEFYQTFVFGIEGVNWEEKDGFKVEPAGYDKATQEYYSNWWGGRMDEFELKNAKEWEGIYDYWAELDEIKKGPFPYGSFVLDRTMIEAELTAMDQVISQYRPAIDYGKAGDPAAAVKQMRDALKKAGVDKVMAEVQSQIDAYAASMN